MQQFEYRVIPAPRRGERVRGLKTPEDRFAHAVMAAINAEAAQGWEYLRAECLPSEERAGFTRTSVTERHILVFRRAVAAVASARPGPRLPARAEEAPAPVATGAAPDTALPDPALPDPALPAPAPPTPTARPAGRGLFGPSRRAPTLSPPPAAPASVPTPAPAAPATGTGRSPLLSWTRKGRGETPPEG
jgi:hypothetical protein